MADGIDEGDQGRREHDDQTVLAQRVLERIPRAEVDHSALAQFQRGDRLEKQVLTGR